MIPGAPDVISADAKSVSSPNDGNERLREVDSDVLIASEVARLLRVNIKTVYENAKAGIIPCVQLGRRFRFSRHAILSSLRECKSASRRKEH